MTEISYPEDWRDIPAANWAKMMLTPEHETAMRAERRAREAAAPAVGQAAPEFRLERLSAVGKRTGEMVQLSQSLGRPVGLIFGSYT